MSASTVRWALLGVVVGVGVLFAGCSDDDTAVAPTGTTITTSSVNEPQSPVRERTPFQRSVMAKITERRAQGLPAPADVSFEYSSTKDGALRAGRGPTVVPGEEIVITAKTVVYFEHPSQAGNEKWPEIVVEGEMPPDATGYIKPGNYSNIVRDRMEEEAPDIWTRYEWGYEPRIYTFTETYTIKYPELNLDGKAAGAAALSTDDGELLMGFSTTGPEVDYSWGFAVEDPIFEIELMSFWTGFELDWAFGIRLPMEECCTATEPMDEGSTYWPTNKAKGLDWSAADYQDAGLSPREGNEFLMEFVLKCGVFLEVAYISVIDWGVDVDINNSKSFTTPFGPGATFPLPSIGLPLKAWDLAVVYMAVGFELTPHLGSTEFTADWTAAGDTSGGGSMMFDDPTVPVAIGPVTAIDGPGVANIDMDAFRYYFNTFLLSLGLNFYLDVFGIWTGDWTADLWTFDLSALMPEMWIGTHSGTPSQLTAAFDIQNVTPTAVIDHTGTFIVNGTPTFIASAGDMLTFTGQADDPGHDDLTLTWDYGDGDPSPDVSTHHTVPHHVSETQQYTLGDASVYVVTFMAVDDDGAVGMDQVPVVITATGGRTRSEGYWQHQLSRRGHMDYDMTAIENALAIVSYMSAVFNEERNASTVEAAYDVMHLKQNNDSMIEQLDRELLAVWLNFAVGACPYTGMVDTDGDGLGDEAFVNVLTTAEAVRMDPGSTDAELEMQTEILHQINNGGMARLSSGHFGDGYWGTDYSIQ